VTKEQALQPLADVYEAYRTGQLKVPDGLSYHRAVLLEDAKGRVLLTLQDAVNAAETLRRR
jgi:hypothetical protein